MNNDDKILDDKVSKKHYPRTNNSKMLEFVFERDPNLFLRKNKILIKGFIKLSDKYVVDNGWVGKLFSQLTVEVDSQSVSVIRSRYEALIFSDSYIF